MKWFPKISVYWASLSVLLIFGGMLLSASLGQGQFRYLGAYTMSVGAVALVLYLLSSGLYILFSGDTNVRKTLMLLYFLCSLALIIGGLIAAFLSHPQGMTIFIGGLGSMILFWIGILFYMIFFKKDEE